MIFETFRQAIQNVWSNKMRTFLTMLGIIIGVMAVIVIVGLGNGVSSMMNGMYETMGGDLLYVNVYAYGSRTVSVSQLQDIIGEKPEYYSALSPIVNANDSLRLAGQTYRRTSVMGINEDYLSIDKNTVARGRALLYADMLNCTNVCVIGDYVDRVLFGGNAIGQTLKVGANEFRVVGVLNARIKDPAMQQGTMDDMVYVPYTTLMRLQQQNYASGYYVYANAGASSAETHSYIETRLKSMIGPDDYVYVESLNESLAELGTMISVMVGVLTAIAGISLLVGGIGIMNIMLVSVTERTREIGIRKALGARERTILSQFVVEAAVTSALGGALGIALGYGIAALANLVLPALLSDVELTVQPSFSAALIAFGISAGIGVLFGYLPAKRAARLNPIEALRYD